MTKATKKATKKTTKKVVRKTSPKAEPKAEPKVDLKDIDPASIQIDDIELSEDLKQEVEEFGHNVQPGSRTRPLYEEIAEGIRDAVLDIRHTAGMFKLQVTADMLKNHQRAKDPVVSLKNTAVQAINDRLKGITGGQIGGSIRKSEKGTRIVFFRQDCKGLIRRLGKKI